MSAHTLFRTCAEGHSKLVGDLIHGVVAVRHGTHVQLPHLHFYRIYVRIRAADGVFSRTVLRQRPGLIAK